jgi:hypothetical protein
MERVGLAVIGRGAVGANHYPPALADPPSLDLETCMALTEAWARRAGLLD